MAADVVGMARWHGAADVSSGSRAAASPPDLAPARAQLALLLADMHVDLAGAGDDEEETVVGRPGGRRRPHRRTRPLPLEEALIGYLERRGAR